MDDLISLCKKHLEQTRPTKDNKYKDQIRQFLSECRSYESGNSNKEIVAMVHHWLLTETLTGKQRQFCEEVIQELQG